MGFLKSGIVSSLFDTNIAHMMGVPFVIVQLQKYAKPVILDLEPCAYPVSYTHLTLPTNREV